MYSTYNNVKSNNNYNSNRIPIHLHTLEKFGYYGRKTDGIDLGNYRITEPNELTYYAGFICKRDNMKEVKYFYVRNPKTLNSFISFISHNRHLASDVYLGTTDQDNFSFDVRCLSGFDKDADGYCKFNLVLVKLSAKFPEYKKMKEEEISDKIDTEIVMALRQSTGLGFTQWWFDNKANPGIIIMNDWATVENNYTTFIDIYKNHKNTSANILLSSLGLNNKAK
jgi:hypothetical protein